MNGRISDSDIEAVVAETKRLAGIEEVEIGVHGSSLGNLARERVANAFNVVEVIKALLGDREQLRERIKLLRAEKQDGRR